MYEVLTIICYDVDVHTQHTLINTIYRRNHCRILILFYLLQIHESSKGSALNLDAYRLKKPNATAELST